MPSKRPERGALLTVVDLKSRVIGDANDDKQPYDVGSLDLGSTEEDHLQRLKEIMCAPRDSRNPKQPTMRPVVPVVDGTGVIGSMKDNRSRETMDRVASKMHATILRTGERSANSLLKSKCCGRNHYNLRLGAELVFEVIGAIIYDMEWTSGGDDGSGPEKIETLADATTTICPGLGFEGFQFYPVFELMLLIDYGFPAYPLPKPWSVHKGYFSHLMWSDFETFSSFLTATAQRWRQGHTIPDWKTWDQISCGMASWDGVGFDMPFWDIATMMYYYHSHRKPVDAHDRKKGWIGYTGVLYEMIAEVPARGTDRLERKLSLDVHLLIPQFIKDQERRAQMISMAQDLASQHGCQLSPPKQSLWQRCFNFLARLAPCQQRLGDEEGYDGEENEKLTGGLE